MITLLLTILALFAFVIGYYTGKISVLKETKEALEDFNDKISFNSKTPNK